MKCPICQKENRIPPLDNYAVEADAFVCFFCKKTSWLDPENFSEALDESIIVMGEPTTPATVPASPGPVDRKIRKAVKQDFETLYNIYTEVNSDNVLDKTVNYSKTELSSYIDQIYLVENLEEILGFFLIFDMGIWGYLDILCIGSASRNRGVGLEVVKFLDQMAQDKSWRLINTLVEPQNFKTAVYLEKNGYNCFGTMLYQSKLYREKI